MFAFPSMTVVLVVAALVATAEESWEVFLAMVLRSELALKAISRMEVSRLSIGASSPFVS